VDARCRAVLAEAENCKLALRNKLRLEMLRLPKRVRAMPLREFCEEFGEN
ncbi:unnamed protein product, partial [Phaeothamnion confervicola]